MSRLLPKGGRNAPPQQLPPRATLSGAKRDAWAIVSGEWRAASRPSKRLRAAGGDLPDPGRLMPLPPRGLRAAAATLLRTLGILDGAAATASPQQAALDGRQRCGPGGSPKAPADITAEPTLPSAA